MAFFATNRFNEFRDDFKKDTGIQNVEENMGIYSQYVAARFADMNNRLMNSISNEIQELQKLLKKV
jgi:hypothetical protein